MFLGKIANASHGFGRPAYDGVHLGEPGMTRAVQLWAEALTQTSFQQAIFIQPRKDSSPRVHPSTRRYDLQIGAMDCLAPTRRFGNRISDCVC